MTAINTIQKRGELCSSELLIRHQTIFPGNKIYIKGSIADCTLYLGLSVLRNMLRLL